SKARSVSSTCPPATLIDMSQSQQAARIAAKNFDLVLTTQRHLTHPIGAESIRDKWPVHGKQDSIDTKLHHCAEQCRCGEVTTSCDIEMLTENIPECQPLVARARQRLVNSPEQKRQRFSKMPHDNL